MSNSEKFIRLIKAALTFFIPKRWGILVETYERTKFNAPFTISYSQGAEDLALLHFFRKQNGFYIDIGAHHPNRFSVTRQLYDAGWSGFNVDANPDLRGLFVKWRPRDVFLNFAVGNQSEYKFTRFHESAISTINQEWKERFVKEGNQILDEITVPGISMRALLEMTPSDTDLDLVNLDIEGGDFEALRSLGSASNLPKKMPEWFLCESPQGVEEALESDSVKFIITLGYKPWTVLSMSTLLRRN